MPMKLKNDIISSYVLRKGLDTEMVVKTAVLKQLEGYFEQKENHLIALYGREDCEKEQLLKAFFKDKKVFYYRARPASNEMQREWMADELKRNLDVSLTQHTYEEYFKRIRSGGPMKLVLVIDEVQYIMKKDPEFLEALLRLKEHKLYPGPIMILLCSSAYGWMEKEFTSFFGERRKKLDQLIKIENLNFLEVVRALPDYPVSECIKVYGILGGVPGYMNRFTSKRDLKENICRNILSRNGYMHKAAEQLIGSNLRELSVYNTILSCIASGNNKLNDIYLATGYSRAKISVYMKNLAAFDMIEKVVSFETGGWENSKKGIYRIKDNFIHFWYYFVYPHLSDLYLMTPEEFYDAYIEKGFDAYLEHYFSEVCKEYLFLLNQIGKLPLKAVKMGTWIGKEGNIDIIAQDAVRQNMVGSCNWSEEEFSEEMCEHLFYNMKQARISAEYYFLFSAKGFADALVQKAKEDSKFILVDMNEL